MNNPTSKQALLVMDMVKGITQYFPETITQNFAKTIAAAREAGILVVYTTVKWRKDLVDVSPQNKYVSGLAPRGGFFVGDATAEIDERLTPKGDVVVNKLRVGAFTGGDLDVVLRSQNINKLVIGGIGTSGVVLSTAIVAAEMDYGLTVLSDCCGDENMENHNFILKFLPKYGEVITSDEWIATL